MNVAARNADVHSAKGLPRDSNGCRVDWTVEAERVWGVVMSRGNKDTFSLFGPRADAGGYGPSSPSPSFAESVRALADGGMVLAGSGLVSAYTRAAAMGSAMVLNSATGVMLPGSVIAPPMTTSSFAFIKVTGSWAAARAKVVKGPRAMRVVVLGGFEERMSRISVGAGRCDGVKRFVYVLWAAWAAVDAVVEMGDGFGGASNRCCHNSEGDVYWGCLLGLVIFIS